MVWSHGPLPLLIRKDCVMYFLLAQIFYFLGITILLLNIYFSIKEISKKLDKNQKEKESQNGN